MIVTMSRRIAVDLYDAIVALRPDWHSDDDAEGVLKVVARMGFDVRYADENAVAKMINVQL